MAERVTKTTEIEPEKCSCCGTDLSGEGRLGSESRYVADIMPILLEINKYTVYEKRCPQCGEKTSGEFPQWAGGAQQYGPRIKALIIMLTQYGMVSMGRTADILEALTGERISCGTVANTHEECAKKAEKPVNEIKEAVSKAGTGGFDETGMRRAGTPAWLHTAVTEYATYLNMQKKRGKEAMDAIGILGAFKGTAVHDCLKSYWNYECSHGLCNAHLLRELIWIHENTAQEWAKKMIDLILGIKKETDIRRVRKKQSLPKTVMKPLSERYDNLVSEGLSVNPEREKTPGKRGRAKQSKARLLLIRLRDYKNEWLRFAKDFSVPFDNNLSERSFRMAKLKQKISGCFRSIKCSESFAVIQSFIRTLLKHAVSVYDELVRLFKGDYYFQFALAN
jgi:transposase